MDWTTLCTINCIIQALNLLAVIHYRLLAQAIGEKPLKIFFILALVVVVVMLVLSVAKT